MREVYSHQDSARVGLFASVLEEAGIATFVREGLLDNAVAEPATPPLFSTLSVMNDEDHERAHEIIQKLDAPAATPGPDWVCTGCQETSPASFDTCWKCGSERPATSAPAAPTV